MVGIIKAIRFPFLRIAVDIRPNPFVIGRIANDMVVKGGLPHFQIGVDFAQLLGDSGFVHTDYRRKVNTSGQNNYGMDVVGHDHPFIQDHALKMGFDLR